MPQHAVTYGSRGGRKKYPDKNIYALEETKHSGRSSDDARDIQVVTDIHVHVEGVRGEDGLSGWRTPTSNKEWSDNTSIKEVVRVSSTEKLVEGTGRVTQ
jgi:hypothetical protein